MYDDEKKQGITIHKSDNVKYYVSVEHYLNRHNNFLRFLPNAKFVLHDADTEFPGKYPTDYLERGYYKKNIYEVLNRLTTTGVTTTKNGDFFMPFIRPDSTYNYEYYLFLNEKYYWENSSFPDYLKNKIFTRGQRIYPYNSYTVKITPDDFVSGLEKHMLSHMTPDFCKIFKTDRR